MVLRNDNSPSSTPLGVTVTTPHCQFERSRELTACSPRHAERSRGVTLVLVLLLLFYSFFSFAQTYPITITTSLTPPYSGYLLDYADPASEKLKVMIQFNDFTVPQYNVKLKFEIKGNGFSMVTKSIYNVPITLTPGTPTVLTGDALFPFLNSDNLDFLGINQGWYEQRKILPEGSYTICVTAYDAEFQPGKQVSNEACAMAWFTLSDPPLLNIPLCNSVISQQTPQNIVFQWTSMNLGSPNSSNSTEYVFQLWEMRDTTVSPDVIAQSSIPIFEQTTQQTTLVYGPSESPLSPYVKYVWRVQAKDQSGRDLFKNQGYSQVCTFKNGDMAEEIGNSIHLQLSGQAVSHRLAKCSWETNNLLDSYLLQVRKEGTENWFDFETTANNEKIPNLEPSTTYEARLQGKSTVNGITTEWSNTVTFTTLAPPNYSCNDQNAPIDALQAQPLAAIKAKPGLIIQSGQFEVFATSIEPTGTPGWYKGSGYALVFGALPLAVKWDNIYIDDNNRHQQGQIDALSKGIESWAHQYDVRQGEENAIYVPNGTLDSVYAANGQVCYSLSGSDSSVCADYPPNTNVVVVRDGEGNQYVVTIYPEPATVEGPFNYIAYSGDSLSSSSNRQVTFAASATQNYGFDAREVSAWTENYEAIKMKDGENYFVPFKSVGENQTDEVTATIQIEGYDATFLSFKTKSGAVLAHTAAGSNKFKLSVPANADAVYAWYGTEKLGKLNVKSLKALTRKVVIVPVNNTAYSTTNVVDSLNKTYKQANVSWTATTAQSFTFDLGTDGLEAADATLFSKYSTEMRALRDAYIAHDSTYDKNAYYLFVVPKFTDASQVGYMVRGKGLGFITPSAKVRDIAHELGHGAFGLEHTFPNPPQGSTSNLMDYPSASSGQAPTDQLTQKQWEKIHSPMPVISWLDGEEDGSAFGVPGTHWTCINDINALQQLNEYKYFYLPDLRIVNIDKISNENYQVSGFFLDNDVTENARGTIASIRQNNIDYGHIYSGANTSGYGYKLSDNQLVNKVSADYFIDYNHSLSLAVKVFIKKNEKVINVELPDKTIRTIEFNGNCNCNNPPVCMDNAKKIGVKEGAGLYVYCKMADKIQQSQKPELIQFANTLTDKLKDKKFAFYGFGFENELMGTTLSGKIVDFFIEKNIYSWAIFQNDYFKYEFKSKDYDVIFSSVDLWEGIDKDLYNASAIDWSSFSLPVIENEDDLFEALDRLEYVISEIQYSNTAANNNSFQKIISYIGDCTDNPELALTQKIHLNQTFKEIYAHLGAYSNYEYRYDDLKKRKQLKDLNSVFYDHIVFLESKGLAAPISMKNDYQQYVAYYGTTSAYFLGQKYEEMMGVMYLLYGINQTANMTSNAIRSIKQQRSNIRIAINKTNLLKSKIEYYQRLQTSQRLPQDVKYQECCETKRGGNATPTNSDYTKQKIGKDPVQNQLKDAFGDELQKQFESNVSDYRVNQTQSSANKKATGLNRPDIQFTYKGRRYYIEIDTKSSNRGPEHKRRIIANDPSAASNELPAELKNISVTVEGKIYKLTGGVTLITAP